MVRRASGSIVSGFVLSAICLFAMTALLAYTNAARGSGHWHRLGDPGIWGLMAIAAALFGFWGYLSLILSATRKTALGRRLFAGLGLAHLALTALGLRETFSHDGTASIIFQAFWIPAVSTILMAPLLLLFGWIGNAYGNER